MISLPESIAVHEVGPRDGLQSFPRRIPTDVKVAMVDLLSELNFPLIEVTNFAHPKMIPNLDDAEEVMSRIKRRPGTIYRGQAPNNRGAERAVAANVDEILGLITVSEVYLKKNQNMTMERAIDEAILAFNTSDAAGKRFTMALGHTMWCPFEGLIPEASVYALLDKFYAAGMRSFYLAGSMGMEEPRHVGRLFAQCVASYPGAAFGYHVHNMSGLASANVLAALEAGATSLEGSICGIGGGIRTPKAEGNMPTEDIVHMMTLLGIRTGIDLESIVAASRTIGEMLDFTPTSYVTLNGTRASAQVKEPVLA
jgi:hydroxymethylglutaryl-CoA lyase